MSKPSRPHSSLLRTKESGELFLTSKANLGHSPATLRTYRWAIQSFAEQYPQLPLKAAEIEEYLGSWRGRSDETVDSIYRTLRNFYSWLVIREQLPLELNPFLRLERPRPKAKVPRYLTLTELRRLVQASRAPFERGLILLLTSSGPRVGELSGRRKEHLRDNALLLASGKTGERVIPIAPEVRGYLESLPSDYLFPSKKGGYKQPLTVEGMKQQVARVIRRAGIRGSKVGPHVLRHSFATHFIAQGGDTISLARILGHSSTRMSERYVALRMEEIQEKLRKYSPLTGLMGMAPATPPQQLPGITLPEEVNQVPFEVEGRPVLLMLVEDRRPNHVYYYLRARLGAGQVMGSRKWNVASLGTDLPLAVVDAYRMVVQVENQRRLRLDSESESKIEPGSHLPATARF